MSIQNISEGTIRHSRLGCKTLLENKEIVYLFYIYDLIRDLLSI